MSNLNEAIEVLAKELESAFSAYENAEKFAEMKALAVKAAQNEFLLAKKHIDACINRHDRVQQALDILSGKKTENQAKLENRFNEDPSCVDSNVEPDASPPKKNAPEPAYKYTGSCALEAAPISSMPKGTERLMKGSLRMTDPDRDAFLRSVTSWYLSPKAGCDFFTIQSAISSFFEDSTKAKNWLQHVLYDGEKRGIVGRLERGVYRLRNFSEVRSGGGTYRIETGSKKYKNNIFVCVAPGLESNKDAIIGMISIKREFYRSAIKVISIDEQNKIVRVVFHE